MDYEWLLTMDQDSSFEGDFLKKYITCTAQFTGKEDVAMFGVNYLERIDQKDYCNSRAVIHLITSGSIMNLSLFKNIGGFDEKLFIDEVDLEYCFNSLSKGFKIIEFPNIYLEHSSWKTSLSSFFEKFKNNTKNFTCSHSFILYNQKFFVYPVKV